MKQIIFICLLIFSVRAFAQISDSTQTVLNNEKNEIKLNVGYLLAGIPELSYEYLLNEEFGIGGAITLPLDKEVALGFMFVNYYRLYFGKKKAAGFFVELNGAIYSASTGGEDSFGNELETKELGAGFGLAIGGKFLSKSKWVGEIFAGVGRNFVNTDLIGEAFPRLGITVGKRF